jgi:hypothetical protein
VIIFALDVEEVEDAFFIFALDEEEEAIVESIRIRIAGSARIGFVKGKIEGAVADSFTALGEGKLAIVESAPRSLGASRASAGSNHVVRHHQKRDGSAKRAARARAGERARGGPRERARTSAGGAHEVRTSSAHDGILMMPDLPSTSACDVTCHIPRCERCSAPIAVGFVVGAELRVTMCNVANNVKRL